MPRRALRRGLVLAGKKTLEWRSFFRKDSTMHRIARLSFALAFGLASAAPALAETELSFYGGYQTAPHSVIETDLYGSDTVGWLGKSFTPPPYYGVRVTKWQENGFGWGVEVNHAKVYADNPADYGFERLEFTDGLNLVTVNAFQRLKPFKKITPYIGAGVGVAVPHVDVRPTGGAHTFGYQLTGVAVQWVAGASLPLNERWKAFAEYKGSYSQHHVKLDGAGKLDTNMITNALNIGISYSF